MAGSDIVMMDASRKAQRITFPLLSLGSPAESLSRKPVLSLLQRSWIIDVDPVKIAALDGFSLPTSGKHPHRVGDRWRVERAQRIKKRRSDREYARVIGVVGLQPLADGCNSCALRRTAGHVIGINPWMADEAIDAQAQPPQIGRASGREDVWQSV